MKKLLIGLLLAVSFTASAVTCEEKESLASTIMNARQSGVPLKRVIELAEDNQYAKSLALIAYDTSKYSTELYKKQAVTEFADKVYLACLKGITK